MVAIGNFWIAQQRHVNGIYLQLPPVLEIEDQRKFSDEELETLLNMVIKMYGGAEKCFSQN